MTNPLIRFLRAVLFAALALIGMAMALVFMLSTAIAVAIPWWPRCAASRSACAPTGASAKAPARIRSSPLPLRSRKRGGDVIDVEAREVR